MGDDDREQEQAAEEVPDEAAALRSATRAGLNASAIPLESNKIHQMSDMTPYPLRVRKEHSYLLPDGSSAPTTVAVAAAMAISPHTHSCDITRIGYDHSGSAASGFITGATWRC